MGKYTLTISRLTVDKLGVKLYDRVSAVIAELISNSYDADATEVFVEAPMGQLLATESQGTIMDKKFEIVVSDNGHGMTPGEINDQYLRVGTDRRQERGDESRSFKRKVMGRKGVGKLAPFGICQTIEVISSGGDKVAGKDKNGKKVKGYLTAHLILHYGEMVKDEKKAYSPVVGVLDETIAEVPGTRIILRDFAHRFVPTPEDFNRQLAHRFGMQSADWKIVLRDTTKTPSSDDFELTVGQFDTPVMDKTKVEFMKKKKDYVAIDPDGRVMDEVKAGFDLGERFYPIIGWVAYSKAPYKDDLMAGIRIYCRGKIAAQTAVFNMRAGFTGEHNVRSYLIGEIHADWLDEKEDLILTDRRDILWSDKLGQGFQEWGQALVKKMGNISREPMRKKSWEQFLETTKIEKKIEKAFPSETQKPIRQAAFEFARVVGEKVRPDELEDKVHLENLVQLTLSIAPHVTLTQQLKAAADNTDSSFAALTELLKTARVAELSSFGQIAKGRVNVIETIDERRNDPALHEDVYQKLLTEAPWVINAEWTPVTYNQPFETIKQELMKFIKKKTGDDVFIGDFSDPKKRPDFVLISFENRLEFIEIKKPGYPLGDDDWTRIENYIEILDEFFADPARSDVTKGFSGYLITLVCDGIKLERTKARSFKYAIEEKKLTHVDWGAFLAKTKKVHADFLKRSKELQLIAATEDFEETGS